MKTEPNEPSVVSGEEMQAAARQLPEGGGVFAEAPLRQRLRVVADLLARVGRLPDGPVLCCHRNVISQSRGVSIKWSGVCLLLSSIAGALLLPWSGGLRRRWR